jgi:polysaccharide export outer membrane protein
MALLSAALVAAFVLSGCGGGNRLITNRDGTVESGELVLDSIPRGEARDAYIIGCGDQMDVTFMFNKELNQQNVIVRPDGRISLPYIGELRVSGMSASELDSVLALRYAEIIINPDVTVMIKDFAPQTVYVLGEVGDAGGYPYTRGMTLLNLLAQGKGPTVKGRSNGVVVIRRIAPDHIVGVQIDLGELLGGKRFDLDVPLEPNDIVYVPRSRIATVEQFGESLYNILGKPADLYLKGWQIGNVKVLYNFYRRSGTAL